MTRHTILETCREAEPGQSKALVCGFRFTKSTPCASRQTVFQPETIFVVKAMHQDVKTSWAHSRRLATTTGAVRCQVYLDTRELAENLHEPLCGAFLEQASRQEWTEDQDLNPMCGQSPVFTVSSPVILVSFVH
jgi:hypothetical protein